MKQVIWIWILLGFACLNGSGGYYIRPIAFYYKAKYSNDATSLFAHVKSITFGDWGLFKDEHIHFNTSKGLVAITGESGAGKSMFVSGLRFVAGGASLPGSKQTDTQFVSADLCINNKFRNRVTEVNRRHLKSVKKTSNVCEVDGSKCSLQHLKKEVSPHIRLWSKNSLSKLDSDEFIEYIDRFLDETDLEYLDQLTATHSLWLQEYKDLEQLLQLERKANNVEEISLYNHYVEEVNIFLSETFKEWMEDLIVFVEDLTVKNGHVQDSADHSELQALASLSFTLGQLLKGKNDKFQLHLISETGWELLLSAEAYLKQYSKLLLLDVAGSEKRTNSASQNGHPSDKPNLNDLTRGLEDYKDEMDKFTEQLESLGICSGIIKEEMDRVSGDMEDVINKVQTIKSCLAKISKSIPSCVSVKDDLNTLKSNWEKLARKHSCQPKGLGRFIQSMQADLAGIQTLTERLPKKKMACMKLSKDYFKVAKLLSDKRQKVCKTLLRSLNNLMPELEMSDKAFKVIIETVDVEVESKEESAIPLPVMTSKGWDRISLHLLYEEDAQESTLVEIIPWKDEEHAKFTDQNGSLSEMLSSGECSRVAIALETLSSENSNTNPPVLILDEIDAHIGGNAAVAVGKLLRKYSEHCQIFIITHNPIVASFAQQHLCIRRVEKNGKQIEPFPKDEVNKVQLLASIDSREREIARMAVGSLDDKAGIELAKSLLRNVIVL